MKSGGYKTKLKSQMLRLFSEREHELLSASDVYKILSDAGVSINLTTVYRNLDSMCSDGVLLRFADGERGQAQYKYSGESGGCRGHLHLKCTECGDIMHLDCGFMSEIEEHTKKSHGFSISCEQSMLLGKCEKCTGKNDERK